MTRKEAINKINEANLIHTGSVDIGDASKIVIALEALGLIKFEEEKKEPNWNMPSVVTHEDLKKILQKYGYEIRKIGER